MLTVAAVRAWHASRAAAQASRSEVQHERICAGVLAVVAVGEWGKIDGRETEGEEDAMEGERVVSSGQRLGGGDKVNKKYKH